jgi:hypothetical protein
MGLAVLGGQCDRGGASPAGGMDDKVRAGGRIELVESKRKVSDMVDGVGSHRCEGSTVGGSDGGGESPTVINSGLVLFLQVSERYKGVRGEPSRRKRKTCVWRWPSPGTGETAVL